MGRTQFPALRGDLGMATDLAVVDSLARDAGPAVSRAELETLVRRCRADLAGSPPGAMPELLERLARQRLRARREAARPGAVRSFV
ncbi:MAG TPA: hypothetical protein VFH38_08245 [Jatrophihabitans sp.]|nr:hypothetical protein [Jatrophihabitans sp.]